VLSIGLLQDIPALLVLGAVLAPMMAPAVGVSLGTVVGSTRLFLRSLAGLLIGSLLVFGIALAVGALARPEWRGDFAQAHLHTQLSWSNFLVLAVGAILLAAAIVRAHHNEQRLNALFPSVALAYALYVPLTAAGLGLGTRTPHLWPDGVVLFALHLSWSILLGALTLAILGLRPLTLFGYTLGGAITLLGVIFLIGFGGVGAVVGAKIGLPTPTPSLTPTLTNTPTQTPTPIPPTATFTPTLTLTPTLTPTITPSPTPTPIFALVRTGGAEGARIRKEPGGETIGFLANNTLVILLPETVELNGVVWARVITPDGIQGWIVQALVNVVTATPLPQTSVTPTQNP